ncbi:MAG: FHA domain-containing protein, partial [Desulfobacterales bacterium]
RINLAVPLTPVSEATKEDILASFDKIDYRGMLTNIPAAMERAIYELKTQGQEESQKSIIFITDGIVDTGNKLRDIDKTRWLRENLSEDAANHGIQIFGIAFTDLADFELIQSLAQKTKGEYFRAFISEEIPDIFSQIHQLILNMKPESVEPVAPPLTVPPLVLEEPPKPEIEKSPIYVTEAPEPTPTPVKSKKLNLPIIILIVLAVFAVIAVFFLFWFRRKPSITPPLPEDLVGVTDELLPEASLRDLSGVTEQGIINISKKVTKIGRKDRINHIAIDKETISRQHAIIEYKNYSFWIIDQGSSNGTFLNGKQIVDEMRLNHGDTISFDVYEFEFIMPGMEFDETVVDKTVFRRVHDPKKD